MIGNQLSQGDDDDDLTEEESDEEVEKSCMHTVSVGLDDS
jgi:hypothetical protein